MKIAKVQFVPWDKIYDFSSEDFELDIGDRVIVNTELGTEMGEVVEFGEIKDVSTSSVKDSEQETDKEKKEKRVIKPIARKATAADLEKLPTAKEKKEALQYCKKMKEKLDLPMKFIDAHFSFDGSRITFIFIADGRVDFRDLVKELTRHFGRTIRLQQIGIRDEAKIMGDYGHCGRGLCCQGHLKELASITSELSDLQQCSHRGSERISGICGRLMCCLAYEQAGYEELAKKLPPRDSSITVDGKKGKVIGHHVLKQTVDVLFPGDNGESGTVVEVDINKK